MSADNREKRAAPFPANAEERSNNEAARTRRLPGAEFPRFVYRSIMAICIWMLLVVWAVFGRNEHSDFILFIVTLFLVIFLALPILLARVGRKGTQARKLKDFLASSVETATGRLTGEEAWIQILIVPLSLALATALIGIVYLIVSSAFR